jgi:hypothetical protein
MATLAHVRRNPRCILRHSVAANVDSLDRLVLLPNARHEPLPEAGARYERTLEAVGSVPLFGAECPAVPLQRT